VVTGASRGIGAGIAAALGEQGVRVVMLARNEAKLKEQSERIPGAIPVACDVTDAKSIDRATKRIVRQLGAAPDILVNNAGLFRIASVEGTTAESFTEILNTNLVGPFVFVRTFREVRVAGPPRSDARRAARERGADDADIAGFDRH